ncbi:hypothetical protein EDM00_11620 [Ornithobacterium rhinotracheale]|uniref:hypothetical protein n=1 Tax=Ornithobacterium rhinotracheale TaxID=28251 RepID=UPI00129C64D4|nr:hypothetical protein [Ornithobacterium rhinotracheale]MRI64628.1 hypothetical protein [Ornithobacterium rhinotracheale]
MNPNKVTLKITPEQLNVILDGVNEVPCTVASTPAQMVVQSIFDELLTKLLKKQIDKRNEPQNKAFSLKLKYYEAYALSEVLARIRMLLPNDFIYEKNAVSRINRQIYGQL